MGNNDAYIYHFYGRKPTSYEERWEEFLAQGMSEAELRKAVMAEIDASEEDYGEEIGVVYCSDTKRSVRLKVADGEGCSFVDAEELYYNPETEEMRAIAGNESFIARRVPIEMLKKMRRNWWDSIWILCSFGIWRRERSPM